jgi:hypothetical protein
MRSRWLSIPLALGLALAFIPACQRSLEQRPVPELAELIETLSGPAGFFDTHNIISNETSYLQVVDQLEPMGGAYIGVGPEQNFTYIARIRPEWAFIVDVRRENMLQHLMMNAILHKASTPFEYLCWLFSRRMSERGGPGVSAELDGDLDGLIQAVESMPPDEEVFSRNWKAIRSHIQDELHVQLSEGDEKHIHFVYRALFAEQLDIRFRTFGRPSRSYHPDYRSLLQSRSPSGARSHFLTSLEDYQFVRQLAMAGRLVPVVGDFAGEQALPAVGDFLRERGQTVSLFYVSNVEFYLLRSGGFNQYVENVRSLPLRGDSLFIRVYFDYGHPHPAGLPGHRSTTILQGIPRFLELYDAGVYQNYWEISTIDYLP